MPVNLAELLQKANRQTLTTAVNAHGGNSSRSFGIVNSRTNGRRLSFSKKLCEDLHLETTVEISPVIEDNVLMIGKNLPDGLENKFTCNLKGEDSRKVSYCGGLVQDLTAWFNLDYSKCTSKSFTAIEMMDAGNGTKMAVVTLK